MQNEFAEKNCVVHGTKPASHQCVECGRDYCASCLTFVEGEPFCEICWEHNLAVLAPEPDPNVSYIQCVPWENRQRIGVWKAFWETAFETAIQPRTFFTKIHSPAGIGAALTFALICIFFLWFPMNIVNVKVLMPNVINIILQEAYISSPESIEALEQQRAHIESLTSFDLLVMPVQFIIGYLVFSSFIQQIMINLMQGKQGYSTTLQIRCYAMISQIFMLVPFFGLYLAELFTLLISVRGFQSAQGLSWNRAFIVALVQVMISLIVLPISI